MSKQEELRKEIMSLSLSHPPWDNIWDVIPSSLVIDVLRIHPGVKTSTKKSHKKKRKKKDKKLKQTKQYLSKRQYRATGWWNPEGKRLVNTGTGKYNKS